MKGKFLRKFFQSAGRMLGMRAAFDALSRPRLYPSVGGRRLMNDDLQASIGQLRELAADQEQNNPYSKRYLNLNAINVIGAEGIKLKANFHNRKGEPLGDINDELETEFKLWGRRGSCEVTGKFSWVKVQELALRALKRDGEIFVRLLTGFDNSWGLTLQLLSASRVDESINQDLGEGKRIVMGIELDRYGRRLAYHVKDDMGDIVRNGKRFVRLPASEVIHLYDPTRADAERGYSDLSASINKLRMLHGCDEAQLTTMRVTAAKMGWLERVNGRPGQGVNDEEDDIEIYEAEPGMIKELPVGYTIKETNWGSYDGDPDKFRKGQLRGAAAGLGTNFNDLCMDYEGVNYTSLRAAYLSDRDGYSLLQRVMIEGLCQPVYETWLKMSVLAGRFRFVNAQTMGRYMAPGWQGRGWEWVDPAKEARAAIDLLGALLISEDEIASKRGADLEEIYRKISSAERLKQKFGLSDKGEDDGSKGKGAGTGRSRAGSARDNRRAPADDSIEDF